ncbi:hypothetical protein RRG08_012156 [Elysia crispata]|uniref:Protein FAM76A n=1 Tax=Elysia crispata TaxID=231223 RepID=A0AAE1DI86_9GAST|nr:hypothetical protein RRG08_012156 [Elysia crispata]
MEALFSCTKCLKRCPFDDLSRGEQLCKDCRNNYPIVKCTYCRAEFQQNSKGSTNSICAKCAQNVKHYGKPTACENCSVLAAFIGNRCQRCVNSEKKWGPPLICEQCKLRCAFDRPEKRSGNGKLMCWLCDQAYKRVLAKTRKAGGDLMALKHSKSSSSLVDSSSKSNTPTNNGQSFPKTQGGSFEGMTVLERLTRIATSGGSSRGNTPPVLGGGGPQAPQQGSTQTASATSEGDKAPNFLDKLEAEAAAAVEEDDTAATGSAVNEEKDKSRQHRHHHRKHHSHHHRSHSKRRHSKEEDETGDGKKPKAEKSSANGVTAATSTPKSTGTTMSEAIIDSANSENVILITQLREQIESLKKQVASRDQQLLEKEKKITELKAHMYETDKEFRLKIHNIHQSNNTVTENLQTKVRELTRQVASLSKGKKSSDTSSNILSSS